MSLPESDEELLLIHNPSCSKSRQALSLLEESGAAFRIRPYLEDPLDRAELEDLRKRLGRPPREWVRTGDDAWKATNLGDDATDAEVLEAVVAHPTLLQRPILVRGNRAAVGRPPEDILGLLRA